MKYVTLEEVCGQKTSNISQKNLKENHGNYPIYGASGLIKNINFYIQDKEYIAIVKEQCYYHQNLQLLEQCST